MKPIDRFTKGKWPTVQKLNNITNIVNNYAALSGDQFVSVRHNRAGAAVNLNLGILKQHLGLNASVAGSTFPYTEYEVIERPIQPSPEVPAGQAYYTLRLASDTTADYNSGTTYGLGDLATDPGTDLMYESKQADNTGHALTDTDWWGLSEEIRVTKIWSYTSSILNFVPVFDVGKHVLVFSEGTGEEKEYYILGTFAYVGDADTRTITMAKDENDEFVMMAVFA